MLVFWNLVAKRRKCRSPACLLFWQCFLTLFQTSPGFYVSEVQVIWKHCAKRWNCSYWAISPFPTVFSNHLENSLPFSSNLKLSSANSFSLEESKICQFGKGLRRLLSGSVTPENVDNCIISSFVLNMTHHMKRNLIGTPSLNNKIWNKDRLIRFDNFKLTVQLGRIIA